MSQLSQQNLLSQILQKPQKGQKDAEVIYEIIKGFRFFENFFAQNLRTMDHSDLISLCKGFEYEKVPQGDFVFQKGDASNNKLYVILSGKVGIIIPRDEQAPSPLLLRSLRSNILRKQGSKKKLTRMKDIQESALNKVTFKEPETDSLEDKSRSPKGKAGLMKLRSIAGPLSFMYQKEDTSKKIDYIEEKTKEDVTLSNRTMVARNEEVNEEEENLSGLADAQKFEEYAKIFGNLVRCFEMGESFGELALKNDAPRAASVLCSTDCEFLVITKQQFNLIFLKKDREKEIFLKSIFPFIDSTSTINYNSILYSFQTEVYPKGSYLMKEGTVATPKSKFFLIQHGECIVEKNISIQVNNPQDKNKPSVQNTQTAQIAVIGSGMMAGEEIIRYKENYYYSVKVSSESVVVHSVSKADFESRFFKEFYTYMTAVYDIKKKQRDITIENIKKDFEAKADDLKFRNLSIAQNNNWQKSPIKVPALENFTPYLHKKSASFKLPKGTSLKAEALPFSAKINEQEDDPKTVALAKEKKNFMPDLTKSQGNSTCDLKTLESMKLFETEPKKGKKKNQFADIGSPKTSALKSRFSTEGDCSLAPSPLQDLTKDQRKLKTMRLEDKDQFPSIEKIGSPTSSFSSVKSFEFYKPRPNSLLPSLNSDSKKNQNAALISFVSPKSGNQSVSEESQSGDPTSPQLPLRKLRTSNFEKPYKPSQFRERSLNQSSCMFNSNDEDPVRGDYGAEMESEERFETMKKPLNFDRDFGEVSTMTEKKNSMIVPKDWLSTFKKSKSSHNVRLQKAKDWRSKIFQKTAFGQKIGPQ